MIDQDVEYIQWMQHNISMVGELFHIKRNNMKLFSSLITYLSREFHKIHPSFRGNTLVDYAFSFDSEFCSLFWSENPRNLGQAFFAVLRVQEFLATKKNIIMETLHMMKLSVMKGMMMAPAWMFMNQ